MGKIGDITTLALVVGGGLLLWKNWDKISEFFGGFGIGPDAPERAPDTPWFVPPAVGPYVPPADVTVEGMPDILPVPPPSFWEFMFPPLALLPDEPQTLPFQGPGPEPPGMLDFIFPPLPVIRGIYDVLVPGAPGAATPIEDSPVISPEPELLPVTIAPSWRTIQPIVVSPAPVSTTPVSIAPPGSWLERLGL